ncbi:MAG: S-methyl-5-thioribose-1-phosphate isomerase [Candidatus Aenigmatarchaeota archaeon]|nr:MAG: S-methyl-5-thioribose-1-phosphate isomerase [Candidatus Aenigmarchaeota archaeon]
MKVRIGNKVRECRTVWLQGRTVKMIDQPLLPHAFRIANLRSHKETAGSISRMTVRGAPAIGATGAYGIAQATLEFRGRDMKKFRAHMKSAEKTLISTRPTAYDLFHGTKTVMDSIKHSKSVKEAQGTAVSTANSYADWSATNCRLIGEHGGKLIKKGWSILTHCNAGALACVDHGTALAPIRDAHKNRKKIHVFVDETRPRCQGARLTAWELAMEGIPHSLIADNAAGHYMQHGEIDMVIVGADRVAVNGDIANKIGTYEKAVVAKENGIPFYVAAPSSTIDFSCSSGASIPIEERSQDEVLYMFGKPDGPLSMGMLKVRIAPKETKARNPAFDVTPAKYIRGIITEKGVLRPSQIKKLIPAAPAAPSPDDSIAQIDL